MNNLNKYKTKLIEKNDICKLLEKIVVDDFESEEESNAAVDQIILSSKCSNPSDVLFYPEIEMSIEETYQALMKDDSIKL